MKWKGWLRGLDQGMEGSGLIAGLVLPTLVVGLICAILIGGAVLTCNAIKGPDKPEPCVNYSFGAGYIREKTRICNRWPAMEMRIEDNWIDEDVVHCTCTAASFPQEPK